LVTLVDGKERDGKPAPSNTKENTLRNILDWDGEEWFGAIFITFVAFLAALAGVYAFADKTPIGYYLSGKMASPANLVCVQANQPWDGDAEVFCSVDPAKAVEVLTQANASLNRGTK
jgi:hypothetical protein